MQELPEFSPRELLMRLVKGEVDFVVVGGIAAVVHGSVAFTQDLDIAYAPDVANLDRLGAVLVDLDARLRGVTEDVPFVPDGRTIRHTRVLTLNDAADGAHRPARRARRLRRCTRRLRANAITRDGGGRSRPVAGLEDLIAMKKAAGRPKDRVCGRGARGDPAPAARADLSYTLTLDVTASRPDDALLDAVRACVMAVGVRRTTLTDVARRAGVSRMTLYRRFPDVEALLRP